MHIRKINNIKLYKSKHKRREVFRLLFILAYYENTIKILLNYKFALLQYKKDLRPFL